MSYVSKLRAIEKVLSRKGRIQRRFSRQVFKPLTPNMLDKLLKDREALIKRRGIMMDLGYVADHKGMKTLSRRRHINPHRSNGKRSRASIKSKGSNRKG